MPSAKSRRKRPVSSLKAKVDTLDQNKALSPKAASGNAVAVPRWSGKLVAAEAEGISFPSAYMDDYVNKPVLIAPEKAEQPPVPVKKAKKHKKMIGTEPSPCS